MARASVGQHQPAAETPGTAVQHDAHANLHQQKQRLKIESRTSKKTQKLVVFPEAEIAGEAERGLPNAHNVEDLQLPSVELYATQSLRRVTAYLTAESFRIRDIQEFFRKSQVPGFHEAKRYDEVLYSPYYFPSNEILSSDELEHAVASEKAVGEVFIFEYGVVVIWGLDEIDEKRVLLELQPFEVEKLQKDDIEIEDFSFCHNPDKPPRLFNDVINLRSGQCMVKLTISHALAQSVKLAYFEELIENTILHTKSIPCELITTGTIKLSRKNINKQIGELFAMRMNVNLVSNLLDTPELFWSYPSLGPLYRAVRGYLEISQRAEVLNQRCAVLSDMLDMLRDHANIMHGENLEWIVILLIAFEIFIELAGVVYRSMH